MIDVATIDRGNSFAAFVYIANCSVSKRLPIKSLSISAFNVPTTDERPIGIEKIKSGLIIEISNDRNKPSLILNEITYTEIANRQHAMV